MKFSIKKQFRSFGFAFAGIKYFLKTQQNAWVQIIIAIIALLLSAFFSVNTIEWCVVLICIGAVLGMEAMNTAIEKLCDTLHPGLNEGIKRVKDTAAGAVLIVSFIAVIIGLIIFVPYFIALFNL
ncbi:MAG: diacylglycerol kinase family protein [Bacteroidales bacterium]|nr:diacylglycerol kinase family protein [Bacteroidales bacterium]